MIPFIYADRIIQLSVILTYQEYLFWFKAYENR